MQEASLERDKDDGAILGPPIVTDQTTDGGFLATLGDEGGFLRVNTQIDDYCLCKYKSR